MGKIMKTLNNYFEKIYCVNLDKRIDRWEESKEQFEKHNLNVDRFSAVDGSIMEGEEFEQFKKTGQLNGVCDGHIGCSFSHLQVVRSLKSDGLKNALVLEDDVQFDDELNKKLSSIMEQVPDNWDMLYFGGNHAANNPNSPGKLVKVTENIFKTTHCLTTHSYAIKNTVYDKIISCINGTAPIDTSYSRVQPYINCYVIRPHLAWQRPSYSEIAGKFTDRPFLYKDEELFEGRFFGPEMIKRGDEIRDTLNDQQKKIFDKQVREKNY